jgi:diguanylate cyclase (GGDEF)-like protein
MLRAIDRIASRLSRKAVVLASLAMVAIAGLADHLTGFELSFSLFYLAPIAFAAWYAGRSAGMLLAAISAAAWLAADLSAGHQYSSRAIVAWNASMRLCIFLIVSQLLCAVHGLLDAAQRFAMTDPLTGLDNRRAFFEHLDYSLALAARERRPLTLAYVDLDDFKRINDVHGHAAGDQVLRIVARTLSQALRRSDTVARMGGDEFALLLPGTDQAGAESLITKTRQALYEAFRTENARPTCSVGAVSFAEPPLDAERAIAMADRLMYEVKARGKDGVAFVQEPREHA